MASDIWDNIGSGNGLPPVWYQAITWTNADLLRNFNRNLSLFVDERAFQNVICKMTVILFRPQCVKLWLVKGLTVVVSYTGAPLNARNRISYRYLSCWLCHTKVQWGYWIDELNLFVLVATPLVLSGTEHVPLTVIYEQVLNQRLY